MKWFSEGIATVAPVCETHPRHTTARRFLRNCYYGRAIAYDLLKRYSEAIQDWDEARSRSVEQEKPDCRLQRAGALAHAGRTTQAATEVEALQKSLVVSAELKYAFASIYSVAASASPDRHEEYAGRAMKLLNEAVAEGFSDADQLAQESDLDPLSERADFKTLVEKLAAKPKSQ